jgi:hypothetical protein
MPGGCTVTLNPLPLCGCAGFSRHIRSTIVLATKLRSPPVQARTEMVDHMRALASLVLDGSSAIAVRCLASDCFDMFISVSSGSHVSAAHRATRRAAGA